MTPTQRAYWQAFLRDTGRPQDTACYGCDVIGDTRELILALMALILPGRKRATTSCVAEYETSGEAPPQVGSLTILTDFDGNPVCVIETTAITTLRFCDMTFDLCQREGEDDCLESWVKNHLAFFTRDAAAKGYPFTPESLVLFEDFAVVYQRSGRVGG
ncbi:ASCH domain-containing protein [Chitiniphilus shinanonensis]|uniref:ASCH domain-containing protein n=1 Tax=Chitiniphilus shinanonensis TaxID=553088 RepID=UPI003340DAFB